ncbi:hypothetical protein NP493_2436g00002 [Ridgeia piscesae]|uniref:Reverse transcriptase domain-containing protein n=1 Tax=Ridgeia piscesae TaxID=27915 RepID=A0AAD9JH70_RIDPI|nr:hypothetical protein NP493_2436g00002 [Ridgeia piscesae]
MCLFRCISANIAGKIFARILLNRLVPETQCGFRGNRSTVDMIFCLRQLQDKCIEQDRPLYMVFVDFSKAFDTVWRGTGLWQLLRKYRCPEKFTSMIEALHTGMMANVNIGEMQNIVDAFSDASKKFGLKINIKKAEVLYQPNSTRTRKEDVNFDGNKLNSSGIHLPRKHYIK